MLQDLSSRPAVCSHSDRHLVVVGSVGFESHPSTFLICIHLVLFFSIKRGKVVLNHILPKGKVHVMKMWSKKRKLPQKLHVDLKICRVASAAVESQQGRLFVMRVACCTCWGDLVIGRCLHCCLSCRWCRQVAPCKVFVNVINTASAHTFMSLVWPLAYVWTHYLWQHSSTAAPPHRSNSLSSATARPSRRLMFRMSLTFPLWPFQRWTRQGPFEACPSTSLCIDNRRLSAGTD